MPLWQDRLSGSVFPNGLSPHGARRIGWGSPPRFRARRRSLQILIEKDFRCLDDRVEEDQSDMFENPLAEHLNCEQRSSLTGPAFVDENDVVEQRPEVFEHGSFQEHACC